MPVPVVDWRFGDKYYVTEFIMVGNSMIRDEYEKLKDADENAFIENVATWIRDNFQYPIDYRGNPAAQAQLLKYKRNPLNWMFKKCVDYHWSFPTEVLVTKLGICIDTSNLAESVLRVRPLPETYVALGEVRRTADNQLLGYHAWVELPYRNERYVLETTIHRKDVWPLIKANDVYGGKLDVYYIKHAYYDETKYVPVTSLGAYQIIYLLGLPARKVQLLGFEKVISMKPRKIYRMWREEEKVKLEAIFNAFKRYH